LDCYGLETGVHIAPISVMPAEQALDEHRTQWVIFQCCDVSGDQEPCVMISEGAASSASWMPLESVLEILPPTSQATFTALHLWAEIVLTERAYTADCTDFAGEWMRDASLNLGVEEALVARGMSPKQAREQATRPYVQRWRRVGDEADCDWEVATLCTGQPGAAEVQRVITYAIGDWVEPYSGASVLYGEARKGEEVIVRRTGWMAAPASMECGSVRDPPATMGHAAGGDPVLLPAECVAHTTWSSRSNDTAEVTSRFLRGGRMVVRRTMLCTPLRRYAHQADMPVVCEEVFIRC